MNIQEIFSIDPSVKEKFPSITIGVAIIKNVSINETSQNLKDAINAFVSANESLTNEIISAYPEVQSYRKLYKETGVDWHSRRPSPEALLRRISQKKGLYFINSCVDAYNLVVLNNRVSVGAFDLDTIELPTRLGFAQEGDTIHLLGEQEPTKYKPGEVAYFDQKGGYNIDFNYRDSKRTCVTNDTKNLLINVDGVYDVTKEMVEKTLNESIAHIMDYCGGTLEFKEIVT